MMALAVAGTRVVFALPADSARELDLRVTGVRGGQGSLIAARRCLLLLAVTPGVACFRDVVSAAVGHGGRRLATAGPRADWDTAG